MAYYSISLPIFCFFPDSFSFSHPLNISIPQSSAFISLSHYTFIPRWSHPFAWFKFWLYLHFQSLYQTWIPAGQVHLKGSLVFQTQLVPNQTTVATLLTNSTCLVFHFLIICLCCYFLILKFYIIFGLSWKWQIIFLTTYTHFPSLHLSNIDTVTILA